MRTQAVAYFAFIVLAGVGHAAAATTDSPVKRMELHDALHLTAAQDAEWRVYRAAVMPSPESEARHHAAERLLPTLPTPRRIALIDALTEQDNADLRRQGQAVIRFYDGLSPEQKAVFDRQTAPTRNGLEPDSPRNAPSH